MRQVDLILVALGFASLVVVLLGDLGVVELAGSAPLMLHRYYIIAAAGGWLFGNVYVSRTRKASASRLALLASYGMAPIPALFLLRAMARPEAQELAPLVPLFASGMFLVFFVVPVSLKAPAPQRVNLGSRGSLSAKREVEGPPPTGRGREALGDSQPAEEPESS